MSEIDHTDTDEVVCPSCGHEESDSWQFEDGNILECEECKTTFRVAVDWSATYSTHLIPPPSVAPELAE